MRGVGMTRPSETGKLIVSRVHERGIQGTIKPQTGQALAPCAIVVGEETANDGLLVRLNQNGIDGEVRTQAGAKGLVESSVGIEAGNLIADARVENIERTRDENLAIRLHADAVNSRVRPAANREIGIDGAIRKQLDNARVDLSVEGEEFAADQDFFPAGRVGGQGKRPDGTVGAKAGIEGKIDGAIGLQADDAKSGHVVEFAEIAGDDDPAVCLNRHGIDRTDFVAAEA